MKATMFQDSVGIFKKFLECVSSKISLTCCTETDAVYQNVLTVRGEWQIWHSGWFSPFRRYELVSLVWPIRRR